MHVSTFYSTQSSESASQESCIGADTVASHITHQGESMSLAFDIQNDVPLLELLRHADPHDLDGLVNILTDGECGRLAMSKSSKTALLEAKASRYYDEDIFKLIIFELQHFGGNTLLNVIRRDGVAYQEIVRDVASFFGLKTTAKETAASMEGKILAYLFKKDWEQMSARERASYQNTANGFKPDGTYDFNMLKAMLTRISPAKLQSLRATPEILKVALQGTSRIPVIAGVLGTVALVGVAAHKISGAAIRITARCVVMIGIIRRKQLTDHSSHPHG